MTDKQCSFKLTGAEFDEYLCVRAVAIGKGATRCEGVDHPQPVFKVEGGGDDLGGLTASSEGARQDQVEFGRDFADPKSHSAKLRLAQIAEMSFGIGRHTGRPDFDSDAVPHEVKFDQSGTPCCFGA